MTDARRLRPDGRLAGPPICDFCLSTEAVKAYGVEGYTDPQGYADDSGWAACQMCAALVDADSYEALARRAAKKHSRISGVPASLIRPDLRTIFYRFRQSRSGGGIVIEPGDITDPTRRMPQAEAEIDKMLEVEGNALDFVVDGSKLSPDRTFSQDALEAVRDQLLTFIVTRILRAWAHTKRPAHKLRVEVKVTLDDNIFEVGTTTLVVPEGWHRKGGR